MLVKYQWAVHTVVQLAAMEDVLLLVATMHVEPIVSIHVLVDATERAKAPAVVLVMALVNMEICTNLFYM